MRVVIVIMCLALVLVFPTYADSGLQIEVPLPTGYADIDYIGILVHREQGSEVVQVDGQTHWFIAEQGEDYVLSASNEDVKQALYTASWDNPPNNNLEEGRSQFKLVVNHIFRIPSGDLLTLGGAKSIEYSLEPNVDPNGNTSRRDAILGEVDTLVITGVVTDPNTGQMLKITTQYGGEVIVGPTPLVEEPFELVIQGVDIPEGRHTVIKVYVTDGSSPPVEIDHEGDIIVDKTSPTIDGE